MASNRGQRRSRRPAKAGRFAVLGLVLAICLGAAAVLALRLRGDEATEGSRASTPGFLKGALGARRADSPAAAPVHVRRSKDGLTARVGAHGISLAQRGA